MAAYPYQSLIDQAAARAGIPAAVLAALLDVESGFNPNARSSTGDWGIAQINLQAHPDVTPQEALNPAFAIPWAAAYLRSLIDRWGGDLLAGLAAYNAGSPASTAGQRYAQKVLDTAQQFGWRNPYVPLPSTDGGQGSAAGGSGTMASVGSTVPAWDVPQQVPQLPSAGSIWSGLTDWLGRTVGPALETAGAWLLAAVLLLLGLYLVLR